MLKEKQVIITYTITVTMTVTVIENCIFMKKLKRLKYVHKVDQTY